MKAFLHSFCIAVLLFSAGTLHAQTGVLNPNDPIVVYNAASPPATPARNVLAKWVKTNRMSWNTSGFKAYYFNGVPFRLKFPKNYATDPVGKKYPVYVFFHGVGERGTIYDNENSLTHGGSVHNNAIENGQFDGFLLYPQSTSSNGFWNINQLIAVNTVINNYLIPEVRVDADRVIVNGLSGGGAATWLYAKSFTKSLAAAVPMANASIVDISNLPGLTYLPMWITSGGKDNNPAPNTVSQIMNAAANNGSNMKWNLFPTLAHNCWDSTWKLTDYFPYLNRAHRANPWAKFGRTQFCPGDNINVTIGVSAGLTSYEWRKDGVLIEGANSNTITATTVGVYDCRIQDGSHWSTWSPIPVTISYNIATTSPVITKDSLVSKALPSPANNSITLKVPNNYISYEWRRLSPETGLQGNTNTLVVNAAGNYQVKVAEQYGCSSTFSESFTVIDANGPNKPATPEGLQASAESQTAMNISWNGDAGTFPSTLFEIYQATAADGVYSLVGFAPEGATSAVINGLTPGVRYYYKIRGVNATAASEVTAPASAVTAADMIAPTAPNNLRLNGSSTTSVKLLWDHATDNIGVTQYEIYVNNSLAYKVPATQNTFEVFNLVSGAVYRFVVKAIDAAGNASSPSNQLLRGGSGSVTAPNNLTAATVSARKIQLTWNDRSDNETAFEIYRSLTASGTFAIVKTVPANTTVWRDSLLEANTTYYYRVRAINNTALSSMSGTANARTQDLPTAPIAASGLSGVVNGPTSISLNWVIAGTTGGVEIWRSALNNANYELIKVLNGAVDHFIDTGLVANTSYYYKVKVFNETGAAGFSNEINAVTTANPLSVVTFAAPDNVVMYNELVTVVALSASSDIGTNITFSADNLPAFATLVPSSSLSATLTFRPNGYDLGEYTITVTATDNYQTSVSRTFSITVNGKMQKVVNLNFNQPSPHGSNWNNTNRAANALVNYSMNNLIYNDGTTSPIGITTLHNWSYSNSNGPVTGNNSGVFPDNIMRTTYATTSNAPSIIKVNNLNAAKKYSIVFYGGYKWTAEQEATSGPIISNYSIGSETVTLNNVNNTTKTVRINGVSPDATGAITISILKASGAFGAAINATQIIEYDVTVSTALTAPYNVTAKGLSVSQVMLEWAAVSETRSGIEIWRSSSADGNYSWIATVGGNATSYTNSGLSANTTYYYKVRAANGTVKSDYSEAAGASTISYVVNLQFNGSTTDAVNNSAWNSTNMKVYEGFTMTNLKNTSNQGTGIGFYGGVPFNNVSSSYGVTTGNNTGAVPDKVMITNYYLGYAITADFKLTGLSLNNVYNLTFFSSTSYANSGNTVFRVGTQSVAINPVNNKTNTVTLYGLTPDDDGTIQVFIQSSSGYGWLNSVTISAMNKPHYDDSGTGATFKKRLLDAPEDAAVVPVAERTSIEGLLAYPNPFDNDFMVKLKLTQAVPKLTFLVTDFNGKPVFRKEISNAASGLWKQPINLSGLNPGTYILQVAGMVNEAPQTFKLFKAK